MKKPITILAVLLLLSTTAFAAEYPSQVSYSMNNGIFEVSVSVFDGLIRSA